MIPEVTDDRQLAISLARILSDDKCEDVVIMDLRGVSPVTDYFVIGSGSSDRQMKSTAEDCVSYAKKVNSPPFSTAGLDTESWMLLDFVTVVVHIFAPEHRRYYDLELLWGDVPRVDWARSESA